MGEFKRGQDATLLLTTPPAARSKAKIFLLTGAISGRPLGKVLRDCCWRVSREAVWFSASG